MPKTETSGDDAAEKWSTTANWKEDPVIKAEEEVLRNLPQISVTPIEREYGIDLLIDMRIKLPQINLFYQFSSLKLDPNGNQTRIFLYTLKLTIYMLQQIYHFFIKFQVVS